MTPEALQCARTVFDYLYLGHTPAPADVMIVFGTNDARVPVYAAELYRQGLSGMIVATGGMAHQNDLLATDWTEPEADVYASIMAEHGVPSESILKEPNALNTADNIVFAKALLESRGLEPRNLLLVSKPFMQRRVFAHYAVLWPEVPAVLASWKTTFDEYCNADLPPEKVTHIVMGDLQRIWIYAARGWSAAQRIPAEVKDAFETLKRLGYTKQLINEA